MDDRIELCRWDASDCDLLLTAIEEAREQVSQQGPDAYLSWALWNDNQTCANVVTAVLFKVPLTDGSAAYELELRSR